MRITYRKGETVCLATESNEDFELIVNKIDYNYGKRTIVKIVPRVPIILEYATIKKEFSWSENTEFFLNGYQSWTNTRGLYAKENMRGLDYLPKKLVQKYQFDKYGDYSFTKYRRNLYHGFTYSYLRELDKYKLIGSLNDGVAFLIIYYDLKNNECRLESDVKNREIEQEFVIFDFVEFEGNHEQVFGAYLEMLPRCRPLPILSGYTSWYNYYQNINEEIILRDLEALGEEYNLFQIDDGYQTHVGDWLSIDKSKFPRGLEPIQRKIVSKNMIPGIWLAPFVCEKDSCLFNEHPEYIAKDEKGEFIMAGSNWSGFYALDWSKGEVKEYIRKVLKTFYEEYGFQFFKLDFLYAAALFVTKKKTRAEKMREAMEFVRECLPEAYILGCGMPLASGFGVVDYCRIGPDVSLKFDDVWFMKWMHRERISTKNTILNTIYRRELNGHVFYNDPDVYLLRDDNIYMSYEQKKALIVINFLFGSVLLTSDNVDSLNPNSIKLYQNAKKLLKAVNKKVIRKKQRIYINYQLDNEEYQIIYHIRKGVLEKWTKLK